METGQEKDYEQMIEQTECWAGTTAKGWFI